MVLFEEEPKMRTVCPRCSRSVMPFKDTKMEYFSTLYNLNGTLHDCRPPESIKFPKEFNNPWLPGKRLDEVLLKASEDIKRRLDALDQIKVLTNSDESDREVLLGIKKIFEALCEAESRPESEPPYGVIHWPEP